jgi:hypothetical protein
MAIHRSTDDDGCTLTFVLIDEDPVGPVSVVGSFNDWTAGTHPFEANPDGSRSVTIVVATDTDVYFRYLGPDGYWFDDPEADEITAEGSVLRAPANETSPESASGTVDESSPGEAPVVDSDHESMSEGSQPETHHETGERLDMVADRIDAAKSAARDLADRDVIDADAMDETVE